MPDVFTSQSQLESVVRRYVALGSGLLNRNVIRGNTNARRPADVYATVLPISDQGAAYPISGQVAGEPGTVTMVYYRSLFSVQWYYDDAMGYAKAFDVWTKSPRGLDVAERAEYLLDAAERGTLITGQRWAGPNSCGRAA